ncbi:actin-10-related [Anaeramoeba ignava]|uniref:Actin-10-related n=1 Tax=Anaeramoeba ignava TaxID=1746090 RepID=A0A9Q0LNA2_ANAIG|nr:actin-10-related [Anaeramoeba ignava]
MEFLLKFVVPLNEGYAINEAIMRSNLSGRVLTDYLMKMINQKGFSFQTFEEREIIEDIKKKACYVSLDFQEELKNSKETDYQLKDGKIIKLGNERFKCVEALFEPSELFQSYLPPDIFGSFFVSGAPIHQKIYNSIMKCEENLRKELFGNIVLSQRANTVWIGGSILASLPKFRELLISKEEYKKTGAKIVHERCFFFEDLNFKKIFFIFYFESELNIFQNSMNQLKDNQKIVIDNGSGMIKAGIAGEDAPRVAFPSIIGKPTGMVFGRNQKSFYIGDEAQSKMESLKIEYPIQNGVMKNWDDMEKIWNHIFENELKVDPKNNDILITEVPSNARYNREKTAQIMFEKFNVPNFYSCNLAILALYEAGKTTGFVLDIGDQSTSFVPFYGGFPIERGIVRMEFGGRDLTEYLMKMLNEKGYPFVSSGVQKEMVREMKEKMCYVALDFEKELEKSSLKKSYKLDNGKVVILQEERVKTAEALFQPDLIFGMGMQPPPITSPFAMMRFNGEGIHKFAFNSIMKCEEKLRNDLFGNIVLSGGSTMFPGIAERIEKEIVQLAPSKTVVNIIAPPERKYSVWIGGSILASLSSFKNMMISKKEYEESGFSIIHKKCSLQDPKKKK